MVSKPSEGVEVIIRDLNLNPCCRHGPTILFSQKNGKKYFSCAALRSHECFYLEYEKYDQEKSGHSTQRKETKTIRSSVSYDDVLKIPTEKRIYCKTCEVLDKENSSHETHSLFKRISDELLKEPSLFLPQLDNDQFNAQYFFDNKTLEFICNILEKLEIFKIVCLGTPRLHDYIKSKSTRLKSILMDIDSRFEAFNNPGDFIQYNMFNNYYFKADDKKFLMEFLKDDHQSRSQHCLFCDPPFAARTELLTTTFRTVSKLFNRVNSHYKLLPIFLVFPYFNEHHVRREMPEMEMADFQVSYMNHKTYREDYKGRKMGSPVRLFTNIDLSLIQYPQSLSNDYRYCSSCRRFVSVSNLHCKVCKTCPSKNGATYRHCPQCVICVKPNYVHCSICNRCVPKMNHDCEIYQTHQECWLCNERGHVEKYCQYSRKLKRRKDGTCIVCKGKKSHNLKNCPSKWKLLSKD